MMDYRRIDKTAFEAFECHLWYLTEEILPLCLFNTHMSDDDKSTVGKAIVSCSRSEGFTKRMGTGFGKPIFPEENITTVASM